MKATRQPWTAKVDAELIRLREAGLDWMTVAGRMGRTAAACANRMALIRAQAGKEDTPRRRRMNEIEASAALLFALISYGIRHDTHLGMGAPAFKARAREIGVILL